MMKRFLLLVLMATQLGALSAQTAYRKAVSILGDSYSTYEGYVTPAGNRLWYIVDNPRNDVTDVTQTWWHRFVTNNGYRLAVNNSYSGATICHTGYDGADYADRSFVTRMDNLGTPDIIFIFGGTNDDWANVPLGAFQYSGWTKADLYSFRPAMAYMLEHVTKRYPNVDIYFILNSELKEDINASCREICQHYQVPLIALHNIDKQKGHPSILGMQQIEQQIKLGMKQ